MALLGLSLLKLARRPASWVVLLVLLGLITLFFLGLGASAGQDVDAAEELSIRLLLSFPNAYTFLVGIILVFGGFLAVVYGAAVIGADWAWGTIRAIIARGESRTRYTVVTFGAITLVLGIGILVAFAAGAVAAVVAAGMADVDSAGATDPTTLATLPELLARTWLGVTEQAAIGFAIAMLARSQLAGIGAGLALYFGQIFLAFVPVIQDILPYAPFNVASAVVGNIEGAGDGGFGESTNIDSDQAVVLAVLYLFIALAVASWSLWRAQITR
jgi:ABC-2 type transport system permease protein